MSAAVSAPMDQPLPKAVRDSERFARHGLALPDATLRALKERGIYCETSLTLEYQQQARRYVLRGTESGGAVSDMGRYCAYLSLDGGALPWLQPIDSLGVNGRHAVVIASELVRVDLLRIGRTYELAITHHSLVALPEAIRPRIGSRLLFRGLQGTLALELWKAENHNLRGHIAPVFYTSAGEVREMHAAFEDAVRTLTGAVSCVGCKHSHMAVAPVPRFSD